MYGRNLARLALVVGLVCTPLLAMAQSDTFVWVDEFKDDSPTTPTGEYIIRMGDLLNIQVWDQDRMSQRIRVRTDGRISLPFLNDVQAAGKGPVALAGEIEVGLKSVVLNPRVTVVVEESRPLNVSVLGEVARPGLHTLDMGAGLAQALASAGGLGQFAHKDRIFVLRPGPQATRIRFDYKRLTRNVGRAAGFRLHDGDVVVVE